MIKIQWVQDFFELRRLRRDLRIADDQIFHKDEYISKLKSERDKARNEIEDIKRTLSSERSKVTKLRKQVRDQTGADLLVNALRELGVIPKPEKYDSFAEANRLQNIANQQARALGQQQGTGLANMLGGAIR